MPPVPTSIVYIKDCLLHVHLWAFDNHSSLMHPIQGHEISTVMQNNGYGYTIMEEKILNSQNDDGCGS